MIRRVFVCLFLTACASSPPPPAAQSAESPDWFNRGTGALARGPTNLLVAVGEGDEEKAAVNARGQLGLVTELFLARLIDAADRDGAFKERSEGRVERIVTLTRELATPARANIDVKERYCIEPTNCHALSELDVEVLLKIIDTNEHLSITEKATLRAHADKTHETMTVDECTCSYDSGFGWVSRLCPVELPEGTVLPKDAPNLGCGH